MPSVDFKSNIIIILLAAAKSQEIRIQRLGSGIYQNIQETLDKIEWLYRLH